MELYSSIPSWDIFVHFCTHKLLTDKNFQLLTWATKKFNEILILARESCSSCKNLGYNLAVTIRHSDRMFTLLLEGG